MAPQQTGGLIAPPPPNRPMSAPQNQQQSQFAPPALQPQRTGGYQAQQLPQLAPPGQSINDLQQRQQMQQYQQMQAQPTGFAGQFNQAQYNGMQALQPQVTGYNQFGQPTFANGQMNSSPFADPPRMPYQPTGFQPQPTGFQTQPTGFQTQATGINSFLPPALQPQPTGLQPQPTGFGAMNGQFGQPPPQMPPMPTQPQQNQYSLQPLTAQKTGPAPPVRFGVEANKLVAQPTGRANLSKASKLLIMPLVTDSACANIVAAPQNPFGF